MRDISAAARAASMIVGAGPCKSQARVAQTGSEGSPPRGALRVRAGGVSVSSGAGLSTLGRRGRASSRRTSIGGSSCLRGEFLFWAFAGGSRSRARLVEPGPAGDMRAAGESQRPRVRLAFWPVLVRLNFRCGRDAQSARARNVFVPLRSAARTG